jgi:hypothetical protein
VGDRGHRVEQLAKGRLVPGLPALRHVGQHLVPELLGLLEGVGLPVRVGVTLGDRIQANRDDHLVPGAVRPDVTLGFPHDPTVVPLPRLLPKVTPVTGR